MTKALKILYVGAIWDGSTALHRMQAMTELGHHVVAIDTTSKWPKQASRLARKFSRGIDLANANKALASHPDLDSADVLWIDKGITIEPKLLGVISRRRGGPIIAGYSPDEMTAAHNYTRRFLRGLTHYDIFFTTKSYITDELKSMGCNNVEFVANAFDPSLHRPMIVSSADRDRLGGRVGFIGDYETQRAASMERLVASGIPVRVWGPNWDKAKQSEKEKLNIEYKGVWKEDYARAICAFDINLGFLKKSNRDQQTTRSVEVPACGGFLLAERTDEHLGLFKEGAEAEFFQSDEELIDKCKKYLHNDTARKKIAEAGHRRALESGYSNIDRLKWMLDQTLATGKRKQTSDMR